MGPRQPGAHATNSFWDVLLALREGVAELDGQLLRLATGELDGSLLTKRLVAARELDHDFVVECEHRRHARLFVQISLVAPFAQHVEKEHAALPGIEQVIRKRPENNSSPAVFFAVVFALNSVSARVSRRYRQVKSICPDGVRVLR